MALRSRMPYTPGTLVGVLSMGYSQFKWTRCGQNGVVTLWSAIHHDPECKLQCFDGKLLRVPQQTSGCGMHLPKEEGFRKPALNIQNKS